MIPLTLYFLLSSATSLSCPAGCDGPPPAIEWLEFRGARWISARACRDGSPTCWSPRFQVGDLLEWTADVVYNQANNGLYRVTSLFFQDDDEWPVWVLDVSPAAPVYDVWAGGRLEVATLPPFFEDGFESGDLGAWSGGVP